MNNLTTLDGTAGINAVGLVVVTNSHFNVNGTATGPTDIFLSVEGERSVVLSNITVVGGASILGSPLTDSVAISRLHADGLFADLEGGKIRRALGGQ